MRRNILVLFDQDLMTQDHPSMVLAYWDHKRAIADCALLKAYGPKDHEFFVKEVTLVEE